MESPHLDGLPVVMARRTEAPYPLLALLADSVLQPPALLLPALASAAAGGHSITLSIGLAAIDDDPIHPAEKDLHATP